MAIPLVGGAAALASREFAKQALKRKLAEAAAKGTGAAALGTGAAGVGEGLVPKSKATPVKDAMAQVSKRREAPVMGSMKNVDVGMGRGTVTPPPAKAAPKINTSKSTTKTGPKFKTEKVDISTGGEYDTRGAGMAGTPGGAAAERMGRTTTFGSDDSDDSGAASGTTMRKGLFGEDISAEDYDAMTRRNKESTPFYGQFLKKGGKVKAYKSGGSVKASSASKRGDGCAQRGKTRGKIV